MVSYMESHLAHIIVHLSVLILVVMEDGLVPILVILSQTVSQSLNPYCSGQWSRTNDYEYPYNHINRES